MKNTSPLDQVTSGLLEQQKCYDLILEKMEEQKKAIGLADEKRLLAIIAENDALIVATQKQEEKIRSVFKDISEDERNNIIKATATLREQIEIILKKLIALEKACEEKLNDEKAHIHEQIKALQQKTGVLKKYGKPGEEMSWFSKKA